MGLSPRRSLVIVTARSGHLGELASITARSRLTLVIRSVITIRRFLCISSLAPRPSGLRRNRIGSMTAPIGLS